MNKKDLLSDEPMEPQGSLVDKNFYIYGDNGVGKTKFCTTIPNALIIGFEAGYKLFRGAEGTKGTTIEKWSDFLKLIKLLKDPEVKKRYDIIVVDTLTSAFEMATDQAKTLLDIDSLSEPAWGLGWDMLKTVFYKPFYELIKMDYGLIILDQAINEERSVKDGKKVTRVETGRIRPRMDDKWLKPIYDKVDFGFYVHRTLKPEFKKMPESPEKEEIKRESYNYDRFLIMSPNALNTKSRVQIPSKIPLCGKELENEINKGLEWDANQDYIPTKNSNISFKELVLKTKAAFKQLKNKQHQVEVQNLIGKMFNGEEFSFDNLTERHESKLDIIYSTVKEMLEESENK